MLRLLAAVGVAVLMAGCATPQYNYRPEVEIVSFPPLGAVQEVAVGEDMVRQGRASRIQVLHVPAPLTVNYYPVGPGNYTKIGDTTEGEFFLPGVGRPDGGMIGKPLLMDPPQALLVKRDNSLCVVTIFNVSTCAKPSGIGFERRMRDELTDATFQQTLIYSGRVGKKINVGYREFSSSIARPAFSNNVEYDLDESPQIAYRGARIEVLDATNRTIKYRVLKNFTPPAQ